MISMNGTITPIHVTPDTSFNFLKTLVADMYDLPVTQIVVLKIPEATEMFGTIDENEIVDNDCFNYFVL